MKILDGSVTPMQFFQSLTLMSAALCCSLALLLHKIRESEGIRMRR